MADTKIQPAQHKVIEKMYRSGKTLASIAINYGVSRERIRQILNSRGVTRRDSIRAKTGFDYKAYAIKRKILFNERIKERESRVFTHEYHARYIFSGRAKAGYLVAKAITNGDILHPSKFLCVDCGCKATEYEHRDYNKPLEVEPVCRGCNARRGQAKPLDGFIQKMVSLGFTPFAYKLHMLRLAKIFNYEIHDSHLIPNRLTSEHWIKHWPELKDVA